jgi:pimeloyl-ACP methyl ester carboxylesterase
MGGVRRPDGGPVAYLHGAPGSIVEGAKSQYHAHFTRAGVRLIASERAGYGISTAQPGRRMIDIVPDVRALTDYLGLDAFAIVGRPDEIRDHDLGSGRLARLRG